MFWLVTNVIALAFLQLPAPQPFDLRADRDAFSVYATVLRERRDEVKEPLGTAGRDRGAAHLRSASRQDVGRMGRGRERFPTSELSRATAAGRPPAGGGYPRDAERDDPG